MSFYLLQPRDPRWRKPYSYEPGLLLPIAFLFIILWLLVVACVIYSVKLRKNANSRNGFVGETYYSPPIDWNHPADCDATEILFLFLGVAVETSILPIHIFYYISGKLHPVAALNIALFDGLAWCVWGAMAMTADICAESQFPAAWTNLSWTRGAFSILIGVLYLVYTGFAAAAVHAWRKEKRSLKKAGGNAF